MIRRLCKAFWNGVHNGHQQAQEDEAIDEALRNLKTLKPRMARLNVTIAKSEARRHLEIAPESWVRWMKGAPKGGRSERK